MLFPICHWSSNKGGFLAVTTLAPDVASSLDGVNWTIHPNVLHQNGEYIAKGDNIFCALSAFSETLETSLTGLLWTITASVPLSCYQPAWNGVVFCANQGLGNTVTSPDGITWTQHVGAINKASFGIAALDGLFCIVSQVGYTTNSTATSTDGVTWAYHTDVLPSVTFMYIAATDKVFCTLNSFTGQTALSSDGVSWTEYPGIGAPNFYQLAWNGKILCAINIYTGDTATSSDGITWNIHLASLPIGYYGICGQ